MQIVKYNRRGYGELWLVRYTFPNEQQQRILPEWIISNIYSMITLSFWHGHFIRLAITLIHNAYLVSQEVK